MSATVPPLTSHRLIGQVAGPVYFPGDAGFDAEIAGFNRSVVHRPAVVVGATSTADVVAAVRWAADHGVSVAVQATGHGAVTPAVDGVLITTRRMAELAVDPVRRTARVGAGVTFRQVIEAAAPYGLAPLCGSSSGVGVVGYTLGGGLGLLARRHGYAADHVRGLRIVTADARVLDVDALREPELFWAVRGGHGNFGVVTSMEIELVPVSTVYAGGIYFPGAAAADLLHAFRAWTRELPDETTASIAIRRMPPLPQIPEPLRGQIVVHLRFVHLGGDEEGARLLAPMRAVVPAVVDQVTRLPFTEVDAVYQDPTDPMPAWHTGTLLTELTAQVVDRLLAVAGPQADVPLAVVELRHLGGALSRPAVPPNAVPGRGAAFGLNVVAPLLPGLEEAVPAAGAAVIDAAGGAAAPGVLRNFAGRVRPERLLAGWASADRERLSRVKSAYDPADTFRAGVAVAA
ncbi:FAD-binding oxidoreductase [Micromonospora haikouensis]|uniref:FAD-binding oxidoreductase n=1 Tax=Micromonospora haikouensis TaxID=686309 RepID=UPI0037BC2927